MNKNIFIWIIGILLLTSFASASNSNYDWYNNITHEWTWENNDYTDDIGNADMTAEGNA